MTSEMTDGDLVYTEILSQPAVWKDTLNRLANLSIADYPNLASYEQILFIGCGSTYFLSRWAARRCQDAVGVYSSAVPSSDLLLYPSAWIQPNAKSLLVAISRSAETTETVRAVETFSQHYNGDSISITCNPDRALAQASRWVLAAPEAKEGSVAQTRSFTSMMLLVAWLINAKGLSIAQPTLPSAVSEILDRSANIAKTLGGDLDLERFYFLGNGPWYGLACEAMLKLKEMSLSHSEAYHFLEFRHGPMSMVNQDTLIIGLTGHRESPQEMRVMEDMRSLGARTLTLSPKPAFVDQNLREIKFQVSTELPNAWGDPMYLPPLQLFAYHRSRAKGLDPNRPANIGAVVRLDG